MYFLIYLTELSIIIVIPTFIKIWIIYEAVYKQRFSCTKLTKVKPKRFIIIKSDIQ